MGRHVCRVVGGRRVVNDIETSSCMPPLFDTHMYTHTCTHTLTTSVNMFLSSCCVCVTVSCVLFSPSKDTIILPPCTLRVI